MKQTAITLPQGPAHAIHDSRAVAGGGGLSSSGKTLIVASTGGNVVTTATIDGKPVVVGLNAYVRK